MRLNPDAPHNSFFQIISTFLKSLDVPWPSVFGATMSRVSVINLNLVELPAAACLHPSPSYWSQFNGYTLGARPRYVAARVRV